MMKSILKWFIPSPKKLASMSAEKIASCVNSTNKQEAIAKYTSYATEVTEISQMLCKWLEDGTINQKEEDEIAEQLEPLFKKIIELI